MSKLNKVISLVIAFAMVLTLLPVMSTAYADGVLSFENPMDYETLGDAKADGWSQANSDYYDFSVDENGYPTLTKNDNVVVLNSSGAQNGSFGSELRYTFPRGIIAEDVSNRTKLFTEGKYKGKIQVDLEYTLDITPKAGYKITNSSGKEVSISLSFFDFYIRGNADAILYRNAHNYSFLANNTSTNSNNAIHDTINNRPTNIDYGNGTVYHTISTVIDTEAETVSPSFDGGAPKTGDTYVKNTSKGDLKYIDSVRMVGMQRSFEGSFYKVKSLKVTTLDYAFSAEENEFLNNLPDSLADDVNAVTGDIEIPEIDGVTWTSSDENVISTEGKVTRSSEEDKEVVIKATFTVGNFTYCKEYALTVPEADNTVSYYADGEVCGTVMVADGEKAENISAPTKEHYTFVGWFEEGADTPFDFNTAINSDVKLYAKYSPIEYTVSFYADGSMHKEVKVLYGERIDKIPEIPEKPGFSGVEWIIDGTDTVFDTDTVIYSNLKVNAKYVSGNLQQFTVTYKVDGAEYFKDTVYEGYTTTFPENPIKEHYNFVGWNLDGAEYTEDTAVAGNITLDAVFEPVKYKVIFMCDDVEYHSSEKSYGSAYGELPEKPVKDEYKFIGWKLEDSTAFDENTIITGETKVYANWEYTVKVLMDEDVADIYNETIFFHENSNLLKGYLESDGYKFEYVDTEVSNRSFGTVMSSHFKVPLSKYDEKARTCSYINSLVGDYEVELTVVPKLTGAYTAEDGTSVTAPFGRFSTGYYTGGSNVNLLLVNRLYNTYLGAFNAAALADNSFRPAGTTAHKNYTHNGNEFKVAIRYNTATDYAYMDVNNSGVASEGVPFTSLSAINGFASNMMGCFKVGDYVKFKHIKVTQYGIDEENADYIAAVEILESLPETLATDPYNVTEDIVIPGISGVAWSSTNKNVVSTNGKVSRAFEDFEITVTATVKKGDYEFSKDYKLTVPKKDGLSEDVIVDTKFDEENAELLFDVEDKTSGKAARFELSDEGARFEKISASEDLITTSQNKEYYANISLFGREKSDSDSETFSRDYKGVYAVELSTEALVSSSAPATIDVGYENNGNFFKAGTFKYTNSALSYSYKTSAEKESEIVIVNGLENIKVVKFIIDTVNQQMWLYHDGELVTVDILEFYQSLSEAGEYKINSLRVGVDSNNDIGDYVLVKSIKVTQLDAESIDGKEETVIAADGITVNTVTSNPDNLTGSINNLPTEISGGYKVEWKTTTDQINLETGKVYHASTAKNAIVSAFVSDDSNVVVRKDFYVTIPAAQNAGDLAEYEINTLGVLTNQPYGEIRYDLDLPEVEGIVWTSDNTDVIKNDGKLNRDIVLKDSEIVTLTASKNGYSKSFEFAVNPYTSAEKVYSSTTAEGNFKVNGYDNIVFTGDTLTKISFVKGNAETIDFVDANGNVVFSILISEEGVAFDYAGSVKNITPITSGETVNVEVYMIPEKQKAAVWLNGVMVEDYVSIKGDSFAGVKTSEEISSVKSIELYADVYSMLIADARNIPYFETIDKGYVNKDFELKTETVSGATAVWSTSNSSLVTASGKVTNPDTMNFVILTLTLTDTDTAISNTYIRTVAVDAKDFKNIASGAKVTSSRIENLSYPVTNINDNNIDTAYEMTGLKLDKQYVIVDFGEVKSFNSLYINEQENVIEDYTVMVSNDRTSWITVKTGTISDVNSRLIMLGDVLSYRYVLVRVDSAKASKTLINELRAYVIGSKEDIAEIDLGLLSINITKTSKDIELPKVGVNGTEFVWTSSNPDVLDSTGDVTQPSKDTVVTLTASVDGLDISKEFKITVLAKSNSGGGGGGGLSPSGGSNSIGGGAVTGNTSAGTDINGLIGTINPGEIVKAPEDNVETNGTSYIDVPADAWFADYVEELTKKGIVSGDGSGYFYPNNSVTREEFVKMLLLGMGMETTYGENIFDDVADGKWYEEYIVTAYKNGLVNGITDTTFGVGNNITRQDMAVMIARVLEKKGHTLEKSEKLFADDAQISEYAKDAVYAMRKMGIIDGYDGIFDPTSPLTRAQAAKVISSLMELN